MVGWLKNLIRPERPPATTQRPARVIRARYDAALTTEDNRRHWINADALAPDAANNLLVRRNLRIRSRYEVANNSYARGIVNTLANDVIGTGPRLQMLTPNAAANKRIEQAFRQWQTAVDLTGKLRTMRCARTQDGEGFAILVTNPKLPTPVKLDLRLVEADQVTTPILLVPSLKFVDGIVLDDYNNPVEYHVLRQHPGSQFVVVNPWDFDRVPASQVIHLYRADRPGQHRGIPEIMAALPLFAQLRRFTLAVIAAAETAADFAGILYTDAPANGEADAAEPFEPIELEKRALLTMPGGWKMSQLQAEQPATTYAEFKKEILNEIARCLSMPYNVAAGNSASYNYASGRLDHQVYYKAIRVDQSYLERAALNRIFFAWLDEAALIPGLIPPGMGPFSDWLYQWFWDGTEHVDPLKEASAQQTRLANHTTTLAHEYAREGRDWAEALRQRAKEIALMEELGLPVPVPSTMQPPQPAPAPAHDPGDVEPQEVGSDEEKKLPSQITICCGRDEDAGRLVLAAAEGEGAKLRKFSLTAYTGTKMSLPNIPYPVVVDMSGLRVSAKSRPILRDHNPSQIVGHTDNVTVNGGVLKVEGSVSGANAHATEIVASADNGFPWQASIGASVQKMVFVEEGERVQVNGRSFAGPLYVARQATLGEVSFVALGADDQTSARMVASAAAQPIEVTTMKFEDWINAKGFDGAALTDTQRTTLEAAFDAEQKPAAPTTVTATADTDPIADLRSKTAAEMNRIAAIRKAAGSHADIAAKAVSDGWDETRTELEVLRASRPTGPAVHSGGGLAHVNASLALEASLCLTAGLGEESVGKWYGDQVLEAARSRDIRGATIHSLMYEVIRAAGRYVRPGKVDNETIRAAFEADRTIQASGGEFSTISLPGILSNLANKQLLKSFEAVNTVSNQFCDATDAVDFKAFSRYRLTANGMFEKVGQDGELKSTNLSEKSYTNQLDTYGRLIALTRQQIINDDLGAFLQIPRLLGRQGALAVESAVFTLLLSNPTINGNQFFSAANKNYLSGGASTLDLDGITAAEAQFLNQVDVAGNPVLLSPAIMLVPTSLKVTAERYYKESTILQVPANNKMVPANNPHAGKFRPVSSPYLNAQGLTNQNAYGWYLFADPADVAAMSIAYFRGQRTPVIESGETDFNTLGMQWRSFFDFGVAFQDFRAAVLSFGL